MESQIMMIGAAIFVGSAILVYIISIFGIREKTYDEVIEEQRRERLESAKTKARTDKREKYKKKYKRSGKDKEDREESAEKRDDTPVREEPVEVTKMVELEIEPEIIEPSGTPKMKPKKPKKQKPILVNKEEKSYTNVNQEVPEMFHPKQLPKDEVELKHAHSDEAKKDVAPRVNKMKKKHEAAVERLEEVHQVNVESEIMVSQAPVLEAPAPPMLGVEKVKKTKKRHEEPLVNGSGDAPSPSHDLARTLKSTHMADDEIQALIDILLHKQSGKMEWNRKAGKSDPITVLKKQLEDKEKSLQEEQQLAMAHQNRIKELQKELDQEKGRYLVVNKTSMEKLEAKEQECLALQRRMHQAHEQHIAEMSKAKMQVGDGQAAMMVQRLQEENKQLKEAAEKAKMTSMAAPDTSGLQQQLKIVQGELNNNVIKLSAMENAKRTLEQKVGRYEDQLRKQESTKKETEASYARKVQEVQEELRKAQSRGSNAEKELERSAHAKSLAETELANMKNRLQQLEASHSSQSSAVGGLEAKLKDAQGIKSDLEKRVQQLESQIAERDKLLQSKESEMKDAQGCRSDLEKRVQHLESQVTEKDVLLQSKESEMQGILDENTELRSCRQRQSGEGQESPAGAPNGDLHPEEETGSKIAIAEHEKILNQLQTDLQAKDSTISSLQEDVERQKQKNNALRERNWKAMEALSQTEKMAAGMPEMRKQLGEKDSEITRLRQELEAQQSKSSELSQQFQQVSAEHERVKNQQDSLDKLQEELLSAKSAVENLQGEYSEKSKRYDELSAKYETLSQEMSVNAAQNVSELEQQLTVMSSQLDQLTAEFESKQQENVDLLTRYQKLSEELHTMTIAQGTSDSLQQELTLVRGELDQTRGELELATQEKEELREKNWKAMEALNKAEAEVKQKISEALHSEKENSSAIVQEELNKVRSKLSKIFPEVSIDVEDDESDWWDDFEEKAKEHISSVARRESLQVEAKLNESLEVQSKLQTQVDHYKIVLGDTESMLNKLQSSVETEEKKWQEKLSRTEKELHSAKTEVETLQESVSHMKGSTEMEVKIETLETQLDDSEREREVLGTELKEMEEKNRMLDEDLGSVQREKETLQSDLKESQDILSSVKSELEKLKISLAAQEQMKKELDRVKTDLASEKSSKEELAQSNAKLNSLLKVSQEALQKEQEVVKTLTAQLDEVKQLPNGEPQEKEVADLKAKLAEREKQLEREIASNRALSQKLAVSAANEDVGTSV